MAQWRSGTNKSLFARRILKTEYPQLFSAMREQGLVCLVEESGTVWWYGEYKIQPSEVRRVWGITKDQYSVIRSHILETNPFGGERYEGNNYLDG
tara:strand:- start:32287 stop:32571 length:285 start_codon:yes stop_codon:yes gene_type:complete